MLLYEIDNFVEFFRKSAKYQKLSCPAPPLDAVAPRKSISICTTCMNRLHDLKETLPRNLKDSESYPEVEFVLLDYNSSDGMEDWVISNLSKYLDSGMLRYCRTEEPPYFCPNHSRNVSFRLARGEIIANVDSDNLIHKGFLRRINQCASVAPQHLLIVPETFLLPKSKRLALKGRFALYKKDIEWLHGFDEALDGGFSGDDVNFVLRAMMARFQIVRYEKKYVDDRIPTSDADRRKYVRSQESFYHMKLENENITRNRLSRGILQVNPNGWGRATIREVSASKEHSYQI
jgi:glycosyltransferase involved in cell wall biosynthesis